MKIKIFTVLVLTLFSAIAYADSGKKPQKEKDAAGNFSPRLKWTDSDGKRVEFQGREQLLTDEDGNTFIRNSNVENSRINSRMSEKLRNKRTEYVVEKGKYKATLPKSIVREPKFIIRLSLGMINDTKEPAVADFNICGARIRIEENEKGDVYLYGLYKEDGKPDEELSNVSIARNSLTGESITGALSIEIDRESGLWSLSRGNRRIFDSLPLSKSKYNIACSVIKEGVYGYISRLELNTMKAFDRTLGDRGLPIALKEKMTESLSHEALEKFAKEEANRRSPKK